MVIEFAKDPETNETSFFIDHVEMERWPDGNDPEWVGSLRAAMSTRDEIASAARSSYNLH